MNILVGLGKALLFVALLFGYSELLAVFIPRFLWIYPPDWLQAMPLLRDAPNVLRWFAGNTVAFCLATLPIAYCLAKLFTTRPIWAAFGITAFLFVPMGGLSLVSPEAWQMKLDRGAIHLLLMILDSVKQLFLLPVVTWLMTLVVISNNALQRTEDK